MFLGGCQLGFQLGHPSLESLALPTSCPVRSLCHDRKSLAESWPPAKTKPLLGKFSSTRARRTAVRLSTNAREPVQIAEFGRFVINFFKIFHRDRSRCTHWAKFNG